jgi:hypothetical protein
MGAAAVVNQGSKDSNGAESTHRLGRQSTPTDMWLTMSWLDRRRPRRRHTKRIEVLETRRITAADIVTSLTGLSLKEQRSILEGSTPAPNGFAEWLKRGMSDA